LAQQVRSRAVKRLRQELSEDAMRHFAFVLLRFLRRAKLRS
jgi:hypothetical protein